MKGNAMYDRYGQDARLQDMIRSTPRTAESERSDWTGETAKAKYEGAAQADRGYGSPSRATFGLRPR